MRLILYDAIFFDGNNSYMVEPYMQDTELQDGYAYLMVDGLVYPYRGVYEKKFTELDPGIYTDVDNKDKHIIVSIPKRLEHCYDESKIIELDVDEIIKKINTEDFADDEAVEEALLNGDMMKPVIKDTDDFLKYIVKRVILEKGVSTSQYKKKFPKSHEFPNLKQGLEKDTKMSIVNFKRWAELLGFDWCITVSDPDDPDKYKDIKVTSADF